MGDIVLRLEKISKSFGGSDVLNGIDLEVHRGEFITLLGASGCGKTTTLRVVAGLERPDGGRVYLDGADVTDLAPNKRDVNTVFQNYALFPHMTVEANIGYSLRLKRRPRHEIARAVNDALNLVRLPGFNKRMPGELSGGQRQRVAIARAVVGQPSILLLDEPLGALDLQLRRQMQQELKNLQKQLGITFVYITHDQEEALNMSDRIAVMRGGRFEQVGAAHDIYERPWTSYVAAFVGNANIIQGTAVSVENGAAELSRGNGTVLAACGGSKIEPGQVLTAAVRSENVELSPCPGDGMGLPATVTDKSFSGGMLRITAVLDDGLELVASRHGIDSPLKTGSRVLARWRPEHAVLVDNNENKE